MARAYSSGCNSPPTGFSSIPLVPRPQTAVCKAWTGCRDLLPGPATPAQGLASVLGARERGRRGAPPRPSTVRKGLSDIQSSRGVPRRVAISWCTTITCLPDRPPCPIRPAGVVVNRPVGYSHYGLELGKYRGAPHPHEFVGQGAGCFRPSGSCVRSSTQAVSSMQKYQL